MGEIAQHMRLMQSWWLASELIRRHPDLVLIEMHPGGGQYDCLSLFRNGERVVFINRAGTVQIPDDESFRPLTFEQIFSRPPSSVVRSIEMGVRLPSPQRSPISTPAALTYRVIAQLMAITVNDKRSWDVRNEILDTSGYGGGPRGYVDKFPIAAERAQQRRPDDLLGIPQYRYWGVIRDDELLAVLDTDGFAYVGEHVLHLPGLYSAHGRKLTSLVAASLGSILP
ncbi:hypothetical protein AB0M20_32405 [Actinoplanes sp. NPDC051633]|uniref:TY-Chap2 family putative peptide chaperone n=1 Tax=Actinoplanes sp. NPDC051633 TaxID=3155670 RepID=UPI0034394390